jgi:hypothetical protein
VGAEVPEVIGVGGRTYPARGKRVIRDAPPSGGTVAEALTALEEKRQAALQRHAAIRQVKIERHGSAEPRTWTLPCPAVRPVPSSSWPDCCAPRQRT